MCEVTLPNLKNANNPLNTDLKWTYTRSSDDVLDIFWTYVRSIYVLYLGGHLNCYHNYYLEYTG